MSNIISKLLSLQCLIFVICATNINAHYFSSRKKNRLKHNPIVALYAAHKTKIKQDHIKA